MPSCPVLSINTGMAFATPVVTPRMPLMNVLEQGGKFIQSVKHGVTLDGRFSGQVRRPLLGLDAAEKDAMAQVVTALKQNIAMISAEGK